MRTFIIRARKASTSWERTRSSVGNKEHIEIVAHCVINAFFTSKDFRKDTEVYVVLESSKDFPRTLKLSGDEGLSLAGFHEEAVLDLLLHALKNSQHLQKDETLHLARGVHISGFGFEKCVKQLLETRPVYLLNTKGHDIRNVAIEPDPVFILSDHLPMPKNNIKSFQRQGLHLLSLGKKMLFASQCVVLIHHELDRLEN